MRACGLELASHAVRLVVWNNGAGPRGASVPLDPTLEASERAAAVVEALRSLAETLSAKGPVHVLVERSAVLERHVFVPVVPEAELPALARFQAQRSFALPSDQLAVVWAVGAEQPEGLPMRLSAVRHVDIEPVLAMVREAGLKPGRGVLPGEALAHAAISAGAEGPALILRNDFAAADLAQVDEHGVLVASRSVRVRGESATARLGAIRRGLGAFAGMPERMLVVESDTKRLAELSELGEFVTLEGVDSALLLATAAADPSFTHRPELDLRGQVEERAARDQKLRWGAVAAGVAVLILLCAVLVQRSFAARSERIAELEAEREALAPAVERAKNLAAEIRVVEAWSERRGRELEVLLLLSEALPKDAAYLTRVRWQDGRELLLTGMAKDWATVAAFVDQLERHPRVLGVDLETIRRPRDKAVKGVTFSARATLNPGGSS